VLDAACGTGLPAHALAARVGPGGRVIATDVAAQMTGATRRRAAPLGLDNVETREMSTAALDFPDGAFDAVTSKDGLMYSPDMVAGARELRRVLRPGGRFAISVWAEPAVNPFFTTMFGTVLRFLGKPAPPPDAPGPFRLAAPGALERVLREAGFTDITLERVEMTWELDSVDMHWNAIRDLAAPVDAAAKALPEAELARMRAAIAAAIAPFTAASGVRIPGVALCASGTR
jgi:SAM-dependent methyltransferase